MPAQAGSGRATCSRDVGDELVQIRAVDGWVIEADAASVAMRVPAAAADGEHHAPVVEAHNHPVCVGDDGLVDRRNPVP